MVLVLEQCAWGADFQNHAITVMFRGGHELSWWEKLADLINWSVQGFFLQNRMTMNRTISWTVFWKAPECWHRESEPGLAFSVQSKVANLILVTGWTEQWVLCTAFPFQAPLRSLTDLSLCSFFTIRDIDDVRWCFFQQFPLWRTWKILLFPEHRS